ncbi:MAG: ATP-dependent protease ATPase subunit HslU [Myxococcales bacterium]|nr:ATP-dependent protease ATPase subunit HslU [Myxococcales bacterium]
MSELTPREIVAKLDENIVGQGKAKRAVAIALRNRWRRQQVGPELRDEILPKNILMIGPTGVGKTEIARRLAKLAHAPFVKVEATKFTEVGYVGRDVESMIKELMDLALHMVKQEQMRSVNAKAEVAAEDKLLAILAQQHKELAGDKSALRDAFRRGQLDDKTVEIDANDAPTGPMLSAIGGPGGGEQLGQQLSEMFKGLPMFPGMARGGGGRKKKVSVPEAFTQFVQEEAAKLIDQESAVREAIARAEQHGIVFIDEIDKVASRGGGRAGGPDVSREGVQRDLLPLVEGTTVQTKYGPVKTDHVLFIAAGAFHVSKPSDLLPELQGRFPIRVELESLTRDDFVRILREPKNALTRQYRALLETEGVKLEFTDDAIEAIADIAAEANRRTEDIGARRLHTVLEALLEELSFIAPDLDSERQNVKLTGDKVREKLAPILQDEDLSRFVL